MRRLSITDLRTGGADSCAGKRDLSCAAYLTVFMSLMVTIILSLVLALFQGARTGSDKMRTEIAMDVSMNSILAEYNRELYSQYSLLMVDMSYGSGSYEIVNTEERLRGYLEKNFGRSMAGHLTSTDLNGLKTGSVKIPQYSLAADNECAVLRRQIIKYMRADPVTDKASEALDNLKVIKNNGYDSTDVAEKQRKNTEVRKELLSSVGEGDDVIEDGGKKLPVSEIEQERGLDLLDLVHPSPDSISDVSVSLSEYASSRTLMHGTGLDDAESFSASDALLFEEYLVEKCSFHGKEMDKSLLKYQLEYLYGGKDSDRDNLEEVLKTLFFWREAANHAYILTDSAKTGTAETIGQLINFFLMVPGLDLAIKHSILFAWSFAETVQDIRILLNGGKVPLMKDSSTWQLKSVLDLIGGRDKSPAGSGSGMSYEGYMRMLLLTRDIQLKTRRLMDVMEMDIRRTAGNEGFRIDACLDCFTGEAEIRSKTGFKATIIRTYGYERKDPATD